MFEHCDSEVKPVQHGGLGNDLVDEAHCLSALCSHTCCWETEQCIAKRIHGRAVRKPTKHCTHFQDTEGLPSLNVVNASEWAGRCSEWEQLLKSTRSDSLESKTSLHCAPSLPVLPLKNSTREFKSTDPASPGTSLTLQTPQTKGIKEKAVKLNTVQISPLIDFESSWGSSSLVLWVPNPHYIPSGQKRSRSPKYTVKELIFLPACPVQKVSKVKYKPRSTNKKISFHLACSSSPHRPDEATYSMGSSTGHTSAAQQSRMCPEPEANSESRVECKPVIFHKVQERGIKTVSKEGLAPLYKLDSMTGKEEVDWDHLRRQVHLWKKPNPTQHKDCRVTVYPTGGASVFQEDFCLCPVSKVNLGLPFHSPLAVAPAVWNCVKGARRYQQCTHPSLSQSKNLHSTASGTDTLLTAYSTSTVASHSSLHRMLDTAGKSVRQKCIEDTVVPFNSVLYHQDSNKKLQDGVCERALVRGQVGHSFPEESDCSANSGLALSFITGEVEPRRASSTTDRGPEATGYQPSTPPPSLSSL